MSSHEESFDEVVGSGDFDISLFGMSGNNFDLPDWEPESSSTNNFSSAQTEEAHYVSDSSDQVGIMWEPQLDQNILGSADFGLDPSWLIGNHNQLPPEDLSFLIAPNQADQVAFGYLDIDPSRPNSLPSTTHSNKVLTPSSSSEQVDNDFLFLTPTSSRSLKPNVGPPNGGSGLYSEEDEFKATDPTLQANSPGKHGKETTQSIEAPRGKKRRRFNSDEIKKTNLVRRTAACIRCQVLKESCDGNNPCERCDLVSATATVWKMPCYRARISDASLFRNGFLSFPTGVRNITEWSTKRKVTVKFYSRGIAYQDLPNSGRVTVSIVCQQFNPQPLDPTVRKWNDGKSAVEIPSYAIAKGQNVQARKALLQYFERTRPTFLEELKISQEKIVLITLEEGIRLQDNCEMLFGALTICVLAKLCSLTLKFHDDQTPKGMGIPEITEPEGIRHYGRRPTPLVLDAQIMLIWMDIMSKAQKKVLAELKRKIFGRKKEDWYYIYLTIFLLTWNLEYIYEHQNERLQIFCGKNPRQSFPFSSLSMMEKWVQSSEIILTHFHNVSQGSIPFSTNWNETEAQREANLDAESVAYLTKLKAILDDKGNKMCDTAKKPPGTPLVWISSLFFPPDRDGESEQI